MHDEANQAGITFTNRKGEKWLGYGDACKAFKHNKDNIRIQLEALTASAQGVVDVALGKEGALAKCFADEEVKATIPITEKLWDTDELKRNGDIMPMFKSTDGRTILMRGKRKCQWFGADFTTFCDTQTDEWQGVDNTASPEGQQTDPCVNKVTGNTFPM